MKKNTRLGIAFALLIGLGGLVGVQRVRAGQIVLAPSPEELRFQLIGNEPIAGPDGRAVVSGWSVLMFKDRRGGQCYVAFKQGSAISATAGAPCP